MTINEAIEILTMAKRRKPYLQLDNENVALNLGIEALKKWKLFRKGKVGIIDPLLPGETEE